MKEQQGLLLVNLGTPDAPETGAVRRYLREFLSDQRVLDIPAPARWALLELLILPTRPARSAEAYRKVWTEAGSPLLVHSRKLAARLQEALGQTWVVALGMRYGQPSLTSALEKLSAAALRNVTVLPLYPQYASSSTGSTLERVFALAGQAWNVPALRVVPPFSTTQRFSRRGRRWRVRRWRRRGPTTSSSASMGFRKGTFSRAMLRASTASSPPRAAT